MSKESAAFGKIGINPVHKAKWRKELTHDQVFKALRAFQNQGGLINKLPPQVAAPIREAQPKDPMETW